MSTTIVSIRESPRTIITTGSTAAATVATLGSGTLAQLNSSVTDATLDDSGDARIPLTHADTHSDGGTDEITIENLATSGGLGTVPTSDGAGGLTMSVPSGSGDVVDPAGTNAGAMVRTGASTYGIIQHNLSATTAPGVGDDSGDGYAVGSDWIDTTNDEAYVCVDASVGAAVWRQIASGGGGGGLTDTDDLAEGSTNLYYTDARVAASAAVTANTAKVTANTANVAAAGALMDSEVTNLAQVKSFSAADYATAAQGALADSAQQPPSEGAFANGDKAKLDGIEALANVTDTANVTAAGALMDSEVTNLSAVKTFDPADYATAAQGALADSAQQPPTEGAFVAGDKTKLDGIEAGADVTDATNVTAAGALMDSEVTNLAAVKAFDPTDYDSAGTASSAVSTHESTYSHGNLPTTDEKAALAGTGTPSGANVFVTNDDSRLTDGRTDSAAIHDDTAGEINALTLVTAASGDFVIIEDATDSYNKKKANVSDFIGAGTDAAAIHDDVAGEINALTLKSTPTTSDMVLIEDAADSFNKKKAAWPSTGGGGSSATIFSFAADDLRMPDPVGPLVDVETATASAALTFDIAIPTHIDGDLLVAVVSNAGISGTTPTFTTPTGWTSQGSFLAASGGSQPLCHIFSKVASSEGATETFGISGAVNTSLSGFIMSLRHCTFGATGTATSATDAAPVSPTLTLSGPGYAFFVELNDYNLAAPVRPYEFPDETTGIAVLTATGGGANGMGLGLAYSELGAVASGTRTWTMNGTDGNAGQTFSVLKTEDWAIGVAATLAPDSADPALPVILFDDTVEEAVCTKPLRITNAATNIVIRFASKANTTPGGAVNVIPKLYVREFADNATPEAWSAGTALTAIALTTNVNFQNDSQTITLSSLSLTAGSLVQFQISRDATNGSDTLTGDWALASLEVEFS